MIEFLKNIKSKIGIYHLEDDAISIGKILKISGKYLFLDSYDSNNKKEGIKVFLISEIKRVILKSDYIEKLENKKNYTESFSFLKDNKINSFNDICQKITEKKCIVTLKLKNDDIEKGYLTKKIEKYYYFEILNDELKIISTEIFDEHYIEEIQIDTNDKINKNVPLNIIKLYSNNIYIGNVLFDRKEIIIFKKIVEFSEDSRILILKKEDIEEVVARIKAGEDRGKKHSIIVLAEGVMGGQELAAKLKELTGEEVRATILGHIQRGGTPTAQDRVLASRLGNYAVQLLLAGESGRAVGIQNNKLVSTKFEDVFSDVHNVDLSIYEVSKQLSI